MTITHITPYLNEYIDRTLPPAERRAVEQHMTTCQSCTREYNTLKTIVVKLHCLPKTLQPPPDLLEGIEAKLIATILPKN